MVVAGGELITVEGSRGVPSAAGIGLRAPHVDEILTTCPAIPWLEIHPENYLGGGPAGRALEQIRRDYPLSFHAVGLSLGSVDGVDPRHLKRLQVLAERIEPALVSEHLSWSTAGSVYLNHLLPLPYTEESLAVVCRNVDQVQAALGRRILVENPSLYLRFRYSPIPEPEFLNELSRRTGCGLLCDVNNIHVTAHNLELDAVAYLKTLQPALVGEIHLAGHARNDAVRTLREVEAAFSRALLGGDERLAPAEVLGDDLAPGARLQIYRHHVFTTLTAGLRATYPVVCRLVDERFFGYAAAQ